MYGAPIQPETQHFFLSPCFKKIYNFYSDEDIVQGGDWVSTRRYFSDQRISPEILDKQKTKKEIPRLVQARIMIGRQWSKEEKMQKKSTPSSDGKTDGGQAPSIWNVHSSQKHTSFLMITKCVSDIAYMPYTPRLRTHTQSLTPPLT